MIARGLHDGTARIGHRRTRRGVTGTSTVCEAAPQAPASVNDLREHSGCSQRQRRLLHTSCGRRPPTSRSRGRVVRRPFDRRALVPHSGHTRACSSAVSSCTSGPSGLSATPTTASPSKPNSREVSSTMPVAFLL
jgi:hypothetical protein